MSSIQDITLRPWTAIPGSDHIYLIIETGLEYGLESGPHTVPKIASKNGKVRGIIDVVLCCLCVQLYHLECLNIKTGATRIRQCMYLEGRTVSTNLPTRVRQYDEYACHCGVIE